MPSLFNPVDTVFLDYQIYLTDPVQVGKLQTEVQAGGVIGRVVLAPTEAAAAYGVPMQLPGVPFTAPGIRSDWFNTEKNYPTDQRSFIRERGGFWGLVLLYNRTTQYFWRGKIILGADPAVSAVIGQPIGAIATRRFVNGFEQFDAFESGGGNISDHMCRIASRTTQGWGLLIDNEVQEAVHAGNEFAGGGSPLEGWDRFYMRIIRRPTARTRIWKTTGTVTADGGQLHITPSGQLVVGNADNTGLVAELFVSSVLALNVWFKVDVIWRYNNGAGGQRFEVWLNGALLADVTTSIPINTGMGRNQLCASTNLGHGTAAAGLCIHFDDWIGSEIPTSAGSHIYTGHDWNHGSHVALVLPKVFAATHSVNWSNDYRVGRQRGPSGVQQATSSSTTALARYAVVADADLEVDQEPDAMGIAAFTVTMGGTRGSTSGQIGYKLPLGGVVMANVVESAGFTLTNAMYRPAGVTTPLRPIAGLELYRDKGNDANASTTIMLGAHVEMLGYFGPEDKVAQVGDTADATAATPVESSRGSHNGPYPRSVYAKSDLPQVATVVIQGGTYAGNGTFQDLTFRTPVHLLFVRPTSGTQSWLLVCSSYNGPHFGAQVGSYWGFSVEAVLEKLTPAVVNDQESQVKVRITGAAQEYNAPATTYQYIAFCDPGIRFLECGGLKAKNFTVATATAMQNTGFLPEFGLVQQERAGNTTTSGLWFKGLGHAADAASPAAAAENVSALTFAAGLITGRSGFSASSSLGHAAYAMFRRNDGSGDPNLTSVLWLATYTGDGTASRSISFPTSGKRPLFAIVVPHNAGGTFQRDPSHTGTTSLQFPSVANAATGITGGGIDSISVGSALNVNAVVYDVLVFPGSATAGNNGWSINGEFVPVEPAAIGYGIAPWADFPPDPDAIPDEPDPDPEPGGDSTDFGDQCVDASTAIINRALSFIGSGKRVTAIVTEQTQEAACARTHYSEDLNMALRAYPWPFATRYAKLVLVAGTATVPVNGDWQYAYRAPANMKYARRIINTDLGEDGRQFDPDPPKFRVGSDATGILIYSNEGWLNLGATPTIVSVELEYTIRPTCAASSGDDLFRTALTWLHAASLCGELTRDGKRQIFCMQMFAAAIEAARVVTHNESQAPTDGDADWITGR